MKKIFLGLMFLLSINTFADTPNSLSILDEAEILIYDILDSENGEHRFEEETEASGDYFGDLVITSIGPRDCFIHTCFNYTAKDEQGNTFSGFIRIETIEEIEDSRTGRIFRADTGRAFAVEFIGGKYPKKGLGCGLNVFELKNQTNKRVILIEKGHPINCFPGP